MILSEQKLAVQVTDLDVVVIRAVHSTLWPAAYTHKCKCLDVFTTESASTDHKSLDFSQLFLNITAEDLYLVVVSAVGRRTVDLSLWNRLEDIVVQPLFQWAVLASIFYDFLSDYSSEEGRLSNDGACGVNGSVSYYIFFDFLN